MLVRLKQGSKKFGGDEKQPKHRLVWNISKKLSILTGLEVIFGVWSNNGLGFLVVFV